MIVVHFVGEPGIDDLRFTACNRQFFQVSVAIEKQVCAIVRPVRGFKTVRRKINDMPNGGVDRHGFQTAVRHGLNRVRAYILDLNIRKSSLLGHIVVVRTNSNPGIDFSIPQRNAHRTASEVHFTSLLGQRHVYVLPDPRNAQARRRRHF